MSVGVLTKYLTTNLLSYLAVALGVFTAILFMNQFVRVFNTAILLGADLYWIFYSMMVMLPSILALSIPMSWQLSVLLCIGTLGSRGEILALRAGGFSVWQIVRPMAIFALVLCAGLFFVNNWISPVGFRKFQQSSHILAKTTGEIKLQANTFLDLKDWSMIAGEIDQKSSRMKEITLFRYSKDAPDTALITINAPEGYYKMIAGRGIELTLVNGELQKADAKDPTKIVRAEYKKYSVFIPLYADIDFTRRDLSLSELTTSEIVSEIKLHNLPPRRHAEYEIEATSRIALSLSPLVFFLVSVPLGFLNLKHSKAFAMVFTIIILFAYYASLMTGISIGKKFFELSWYGPWLGNLLTVFAAVFLWRKKFIR